MQIFFSSCGAWGLTSSGARASHRSGLLLQSTAPRGLSSWGTWPWCLWLPGSRARAPWLWHTGLVAPRYGGFSWVRDQTHVSCTGKQILYHWTIREALTFFFFFIRKYSFLAQTIENPPAMQDTQVRSLGREDSLEMTGYSPWGRKE